MGADVYTAPEREIQADETIGFGKVLVVEAWNYFMSKNFLASLDVADCTFAVESLASVPGPDAGRFRRTFLKYGFAIIQEPAARQSAESLLSLKALFGSVHGHDRATADGIARIEFNPSMKDYLGCSNEEHSPHTDGTFDPIPPRIMCLQCVRNADEGGDSILVSGAAILEHLLAQDRENLKALFDADALTVERKGKTFTGPVLSRGEGNHSIRFRSDSSASLRIKSSAVAGFESMKMFVLNPHNQLRFRMEPGQTLVLDNSAILHGRTAFKLPSSRCLNRLNFDGNTQFCQTLELGFMPDAKLKFSVA